MALPGSIFLSLFLIGVFHTGYWIVESTVDLPSEHFPTGGFAYLKAICGWASAAGINVILDLHGAPGAQQVDQPSTGQYAPTVGFYDQYNYDRAYAFFTNITSPSGFISFA